MNFFDKYTSNYDMTIKENNYKYHHSYRVMEQMLTLAKNMSLPSKDIELAKCIGLLHDIARFEQFKRYSNFNDDVFDHGNYAVEILKETDALKHFEVDESDYEVVYKAIKNHNKYAIEANLTPRELLFAKMIRDADKLDILYAIGNDKLKGIVYEDDSEISKRVENDFYHHKLIKRNFKENENENLVVLFSFVFDFNFTISLKLIKHNEYYQKIYNRLTHKDLFLPYIEYINKYIAERTE